MAKIRSQVLKEEFEEIEKLEKKRLDSAMTKISKDQEMIQQYS